MCMLMGWGLLRPEDVSNGGDKAPFRVLLFMEDEGAVDLVVCG